MMIPGLTEAINEWEEIKRVRSSTYKIPKEVPMESAKEVLTTAIKKEVSIEKAIDIFSEEVKKAVTEREFWRDTELRRAQTIITRQKQELDLAVKELVKTRKVIQGMRELVGER